MKALALVLSLCICGCGINLKNSKAELKPGSMLGLGGAALLSGIGGALLLVNSRKDEPSATLGTMSSISLLVGTILGFGATFFTLNNIEYEASTDASSGQKMRLSQLEQEVKSMRAHLSDQSKGAQKPGRLTPEEKAEDKTLEEVHEKMRLLEQARCYGACLEVCSLL